MSTTTTRVQMLLAMVAGLGGSRFKDIWPSRYGKPTTQWHGIPQTARQTTSHRASRARKRKRQQVQASRRNNR